MTLHIWFYVSSRDRARYLISTKPARHLPPIPADKLNKDEHWRLTSPYSGRLARLLRQRAGLGHVSIDETTPEEVVKWITLASMGLPINPPDTLDQLLHQDPLD